MFLSKRLNIKHHDLHIADDEFAEKIDVYLDHCEAIKKIPTLEGIAVSFNVTKNDLLNKLRQNDDMKRVHEHIKDRVIDITLSLGVIGPGNPSPQIVLAHLKRYEPEYRDKQTIDLNQKAVGFMFNIDMSKIDRNDMKAIGDLARKQLDMDEMEPDEEGT